MPTDVPSQFFQPFLHVTVFSVALNCPRTISWNQAYLKSKASRPTFCFLEVVGPRAPETQFTHDHLFLQGILWSVTVTIHVKWTAENLVHSRCSIRIVFLFPHKSWDGFVAHPRSKPLLRASLRGSLRHLGWKPTDPRASLFFHPSKLFPRRPLSQKRCGQSHSYFTEQTNPPSNLCKSPVRPKIIQ